MVTYELGQLITVSWTNNNRRYKAIAKVVKVNEKTVRISLTENSSGYSIGQSWAISTVKQTSGNNISPVADLKAVQEFNAEEQRLNKLGEEFAAKYWEQRSGTALI